MRLRDYRDILEKNLPLLKYDIVQTPGNSGAKTISNYADALSAVDNFIDVNLFPTLTQQIIAFSNIYNSRFQSVSVENQVANNFALTVEKLKASAISLKEAIDVALPSQSKNSFSIKLPEIISLGDLTKFFEDLNLILNQSLINEYVNGEIRIQNFDTGTNWIEIIIIGDLAVSFFASMIWAAAVVRKKLVEGQILAQQVKGLKVRNEVLEEIKEGTKKELELLLSSETNNLLTQIEDKNPDPEYAKRLNFSIKSLAELIEKGTEIYPALQAPEEVKNLLPDFKALDSIQSKIKQLSQ